MSRQFIFDTLRTPALEDKVGDRVFQQASVLTAQHYKPFLIYTIGNNTDEGMADPDTYTPSRQFFQVYIHDAVGDYAQIDDLIKLVKTAFLTAALPDDVSGVQYLETSRDLDDPTLQTIMRYVRFQLAMAR